MKKSKNSKSVSLSHYDFLNKSIAHLCQSIPSFENLSKEQRMVLIQSVGLGPKIAADVANTFERLFDERPENPSDILDPLRCVISWRPSIKRPVFAGYQDINLNLPTPSLMFFSPGSVYDTTMFDPIEAQVRIFYPTVVPSGKDAPFLADCGSYPLVIFLHGQCPRNSISQYKLWYYLPQQLARCGYVVVVPQLEARFLASTNSGVNLAENVVNWMRQKWVHRHYLTSADQTSLVGHTKGALLAGELSLRIPSSTCVSLSGEWNKLPFDNHILGRINVPMLFTWGTGTDFFTDLDLDANLFDMVRNSKHKIKFYGANTFDYLSSGGLNGCNNTSEGPCKLTKFLAADYTTLFIARYMPPPDTHVWIAPELKIIDESELTDLQKEFALENLIGYHLMHKAEVNELSALLTGNCELTHTWVLDSGVTGSIVLPES